MIGCCLSLDQHRVWFILYFYTIIHDLLLLARRPLIKHVMCDELQPLWFYIGSLGISGIGNWVTNELLSLWWSSEGCFKCFELTDRQSYQLNVTLNLYLCEACYFKKHAIKNTICIWLIFTDIIVNAKFCLRIYLEYAEKIFDTQNCKKNKKKNSRHSIKKIVCGMKYQIDCGGLKYSSGV